MPKTGDTRRESTSRKSQEVASVNFEVYNVVSDIRVAIEQLQFLLTAPETLSLSFHKYIPASTNSDRRTMLERIWNNWIENFLNQSLHHAVLIALGLREQPDVVAKVAGKVL